MLDLNRTVRVVVGALFDAEATWRSYLPEAGDWKKTAVLLTGPLIMASAVLAWLVGLAGSDASLFGQYRPTVASTLLAIALGAVAAGVVAFIFGGLAGVFGGKRSFALGLAATTIAFVPVYLGRVVTWLPWIGGLLALGLVIYALVLLWRIIPIYLQVPDGRRAGHYILSLLATLVAIFLLSSLVSRTFYGMAPDSPFAGTSPFGRTDDRADSSSAPGGMLGDSVRRAQLMAAAQEDRYTPPANGQLNEDQVKTFVRVMDRAAEMRQEAGLRLQNIMQNAQQEQDMGLGDLSELMGTATNMGALQTAEIEVVKSGGGNWAEHEWVRQSLRTAWIQRDIDDAVSHNYALYRKYEDRLAPHVTQ